VVESVKTRLKEQYPIIEVNGVRFLHQKGWGFVQASNIEPALVLRCEASSREALEEIKSLAEKLVLEEIALEREVG